MFYIATPNCSDSDEVFTFFFSSLLSVAQAPILSHLDAQSVRQLQLRGEILSSQVCFIALSIRDAICFVLGSLLCHLLSALYFVARHCSGLK